MDSQTQTRNTTNRELTISVKDKTYEGNDNINFKSKTVIMSSLPEIAKNHNYSLIKWNDDIRKAENFKSASGYIIDIDDGMTIEKAQKVLTKNNISAVLVTTRNHTEEAHRFRVIVPTDRIFKSLDDYSNKLITFVKKYFPQNDPAVLDGGRFFFGSPSDAVVFENYESDFFDADFKVEPGKNGVKQINKAWDDSLEITQKDGSTVSVTEIEDKQSIFCPFHNDNTPSAFIDKHEESENYFIYCSKCKKTYWKTIDLAAQLPQKCAGYYSYLNTVYEAHLSKDKLQINLLGKEKFFIKTNTYSEEDMSTIFRYLVKNQHIITLETNYISDPESTEISYIYNIDAECFEVKVAPVPIIKKDNEFIEKYLEEKFGKHINFIKEWLAVYCFSNYMKLPDLLLIGDRGCGKNTFAELVRRIYEPISAFSKDVTARFNAFAENKLLIIDESDDHGKPQYTLLKRLKGQNRLQIEKKYKEGYGVKNNLNIIILSNNKIPIHVDSFEKPADERNNQFFVYKIPYKHKTIIQKYEDELIDRFGFYMMSVLKPIFDSLDFSDKRYSIEVPITEEEKNLFNISKTEIEGQADQLIKKLLDEMDNSYSENYKFINQGFLPSDWIDIYANKYDKQKIIREFQKHDYLTPNNSEKKQVGSLRKRCYKLGSRWFDELKNEQNGTADLVLETDTTKLKHEHADMFVPMDTETEG
jgi:hypothetical protein